MAKRKKKVPANKKPVRRTKKQRKSGRPKPVADTKESKLPDLIAGKFVVQSEDRLLSLNEIGEMVFQTRDQIGDFDAEIVCVFSTEEEACAYIPEIGSVAPLSDFAATHFHSSTEPPYELSCSIAWKGQALDKLQAYRLARKELLSDVELARFNVNTTKNVIREESKRLNDAWIHAQKALAQYDLCAKDDLDEVSKELSSVERELKSFDRFLVRKGVNPC